MEFRSDRPDEKSGREELSLNRSMEEHACDDARSSHGTWLPANLGERPERPAGAPRGDGHLLLQRRKTLVPALTRRNLGLYHRGYLITWGSVWFGACWRRDMSGAGVHVNFNASASLRKWPSRGGQRMISARHPSPYMLMENTLGECLREFMAKPASQRHLYEIHTSPQEPLITAVISAEHAAELARLREFL